MKLHDFVDKKVAIYEQYRVKKKKLVGHVSDRHPQAFGRSQT